MTFVYSYLAYILGMLLHITIKILNINKETIEAATPDKILKQMFKSDWPLLFMSLLGGIAWLIAIGFYFQITPEDQYIPNIAIRAQSSFKKGLYLGSILAGAVGDLLILGIFSYTKTAIEKKFPSENQVPTKQEAKAEAKAENNPPSDPRPL
jgi:hypothetical protein